MLPRVALLLLVAGAGAASGMKTRETVERTVMVRTTGSDLQPAATGYVYKKKNDGEESVVEMDEGEIMKRLSEFYERPIAERRAGPGPAGLRPAGERRVIPVTEKDQDRVDGLADEDYEKIFNDYSPTYHNHGHGDYLRSSKRFRSGLYHQYDGDSAEDDAGYRHYRRGGPGLYRERKLESYTATGGDDDGHRPHREDDPKTYRDRKTGRGFHKIYDNKREYSDHEYVGEKVEAFPEARQYYGIYDVEHEYDGPHTSHHDDELGRAAARAEPAGEPAARAEPAREPAAPRPAEGGSDSSREPHGRHGSGSGRAEGENFGFGVRH